MTKASNPPPRKRDEEDSFADKSSRKREKYAFSILCNLVSFVLRESAFSL